VIEAQKENIRPTPAGRSAATLSTLLDKDAVADQRIQEGHERFRRQIAEAERRELEGEDMEDGVLDVLDVHNR
jgi:checkpoint serine/threonine-protein kinase